VSAGESSCATRIDGPLSSRGRVEVHCERAHELPQDALAHEIHVAAALAEVVVVGVVEELLDVLDGAPQGPLGVDPLGADGRLGLVGEQRVVEHEQVRVEDERVVLRGLGQRRADAVS
jgi:hypothetical protein